MSFRCTLTYRLVILQVLDIGSIFEKSGGLTTRVHPTSRG